MSSDVVVPDPRWYGLVGFYGGYVAALLAERAAHPDYRLRHLTIRFAGAVEREALTFESEALHRGAQSAATRILLIQEGRVKAEATATLLRDDDSPRARVRTIDEPASAPPADYRGRVHVQGDLAFVRNLEILAPPLGGVDAGIVAWLRLRSGVEELGVRTGAARACLLLDALLPVAFAGDDPPAFVPSLEFSYAFSPAADDLGPDWCIGRNDLDWIDEGFCGEDATLRRAQDGRLVARQRQIRSIRRTLAPDPDLTTPGGQQ